MNRILRNVVFSQSKNSLTRIINLQRSASTTNGNQPVSKGNQDAATGPPPAPPPPELCCRSGCQNCVWLEYVDDMLKYYKNNKQEARKALEQIPDETLKTFIRIELGL
ncbi:oxidoreductase-like domain-containing protein 1 [Exaiptasia diaphana]|uniref:Oxidoreductase-like domain-containing protein n=1 Tax=Exaiptasia diaphana TaxID=2652724 RepID=A0A913Y9J8_EXADI|nr:oxidoreductase-like domain-containing protein 1 [Exaiptasia diaphana]KXJ21700.1 Oxidoreductase-like domain-containing protein 1 [Exaiptasia diaphana]